MPRVGFEPTIPVFEQSKTVRALECAAIGNGSVLTCVAELWEIKLYSKCDGAYPYVSDCVTDAYDRIYNNFSNHDPRRYYNLYAQNSGG
jgi:hypothetical protein